MKAVLVHGMFTKDGGKSSIGRLAPALEAQGFEVALVNCGWWGLLRVLFGDRFRTDKKVLHAVWDADLVIAHSRGAVVTHRALSLLPVTQRKRVLALFSPALNNDIGPPASVDHRFVYFSEKDKLVKLSTYIPFRMMGRLGATGFQGQHPRNTDINETFRIGSDHSGWFKGLNAEHYAIDAGRRAREVL